MNIRNGSNDPLFPIYFGTIVPGGEWVNGWGVKNKFPAGTPGPFPCCEGEDKVCKDITRWRDYVKAPNLVLPAEAWKDAVEQVSKIDRKEKFVTAKVFCGIFEKLHYLMGMEDAMINFYEEPEAMHELIDYLADWEITLAEETIKYVHPDCLFHHDDWGSQTSLFISKEMFDEFLLPAYKKILRLLESERRGGDRTPQRFLCRGSGSGNDRDGSRRLPGRRIHQQHPGDHQEIRRKDHRHGRTGQRQIRP